MSAVTLTKTYDPLLGMPAEITTTTSEQALALILDDLDWAEGLVEGGEVRGFVTLNTDSADEPGTYFLVWHMRDEAPQIDTFTLTDAN